VEEDTFLPHPTSPTALTHSERRVVNRDPLDEAVPVLEGGDGFAVFIKDTPENREAYNWHHRGWDGRTLPVRFLLDADEVVIIDE